MRQLGSDGVVAAAATSLGLLMAMAPTLALRRRCRSFCSFFAPTPRAPSATRPAPAPRPPSSCSSRLFFLCRYYGSQFGALFFSRVWIRSVCDAGLHNLCGFCWEMAVRLFAFPLCVPLKCSTRAWCRFFVVFVLSLISFEWIIRWKWECNFSWFCRIEELVSVVDNGDFANLA